MNIENSKERIKEILGKYNRVAEEKTISQYNEEMTKKDFILPLFKALGWDTENSNEVTAEESISRKRVDYGFRINNIPKFFLEAKSLREDLSNPDFVKQAVNYSWHKGCTWAVLTNFKELYVFNSEVKGFNPLQIALFSIRCDEFLDKFNQLCLLSRESFEQGLIDKEAEKWGKKLKKTSVDKQLLADFTRFRELLSKNAMKLNQNRNLTESDLDESVQRILDRLIFIRNCEDRELEPKILISNFREWESRGRGQLIKNLRTVFKEFDQKYNSKLFQEHLCDTIDIENEVLSEIISGLYNTKDMAVPYDFSAIEADVLGNIYEQYLGHILKKTDKRAKLSESHAHRKEQGIYYTPTYIVDYIVQNTLGELLKEKGIDAKKIRVLDPACGSGSFLIRAFDVLKEYHQQKADKYTQVDYDEILRNNIFGVDLDKQAVEIAQLNLLLKIAEKGHRLPLLQENIKCGNSLIDDEKVSGDKAFKWEKEFKQIMDEGGFDVVVGNPPYIRNRELKENEKQFMGSHFKTAEGQYDIYQLFFEQAIKLLNERGLIGFITSNKYAITSYGTKLRKFILENCQILTIVDVSNIQVFRDASTYPYVIILRKDLNEESRNNNDVKIIRVNDWGELSTSNHWTIKQKDFLKNENFTFDTGANENKNLLNKLQQETVKLGDIIIIKETVHTGNIRDKLISDKQLNNKYKKLLRGKDCQRYYYSWQNLWINTDTNTINKSKGEYATIPDKAYFEQPKIFLREIAENLTACYDEENYYSLNKAYVLNQKDEKYPLKFVLGLLNSKILSRFFRIKFESAHVRGGHLQFKKQYTSQIPIKITSEENKEAVMRLVDKMLSLNKCLKELGDKKTDERAKIEEGIKKTDAEIDELVYRIYGITDEERRIIEGGCI